MKKLSSFITKKIDESIQIDIELSSEFKDKSSHAIHSERKIAKRLGISYQKYFIVLNHTLQLI